MDAFRFTFLPSSSPLFPSSKPYLPPLLPRLPSAQSRSHPSRKNLPRISTSESHTVVVPAEDPIAAGDISGEKFDWYSHWYPVAPVCDLDKKAPRAVTVLGLDLVCGGTGKRGNGECSKIAAPIASHHYPRDESIPGGVSSASSMAGALTAMETAS